MIRNLMRMISPHPHRLLRRATRTLNNQLQDAQIHLSAYRNKRDKNADEMEKALIAKQGGLFDEAAKIDRDRKTFEAAISVYLKREGVHRRGSVEFIYAALKRMKEFGINRDIEAYKSLLKIFPVGKMVAKSAWQVEMQHYPKHQQCCMDLLEQMEENGITPDDEIGNIVYSVFGKDTHAMRKYQRMMYWMPKFKNINPWPIPKYLPTDPTELARLALKRMSRDRENMIDVYWTNDLQDRHDLFVEDTFVVGAQAPEQMKLLEEHPLNQPVYVEGGYHVWIKEKMLTYFVLTSECDPSVFEKYDEQKNKVEDDANLFTFPSFFESEQPESSLVLPPSVHQQEGGNILAMCISGTGSKDSLKCWIRFLERTNPALKKMAVVFQLRTPEGGLVTFNPDEKDTLTVTKKPTFSEEIRKTGANKR
ncbi:evolutionarily conserved signaling intermediate in Toll pathway, mitochondrial-like [Tubulanus polymorphus]|uniref:evolutionarily conserved signaling intermediate in Toll pathway, mitochondrial-like n=1 Tax=Tubulanus polymorphus TaxID=672921 RepID=UPI003DA61CF2